MRLKLVSQSEPQRRNQPLSPSLSLFAVSAALATKFANDLTPFERNNRFFAVPPMMRFSPS